MLTLVRYLVLLLVLPILSVMTAGQASPVTDRDAPIYGKRSLVEAKVVSSQAKPVLPHTKRVSTEMEDDEDGDDSPLVGLVRSYDGDDQIQPSFQFAQFAFRFVLFVVKFRTDTPQPIRFTCTGFPTGPPSV